ncbi:MAG: SAM-dependent methyltransferase, partial [Candidatus Binatia bacterium]
MNEAVVVSSLPSLPADLQLRDRIATRLVLAQLSRWRAGSITLVLPDGRILKYGDASSERRVTLTVKSWRFFWRALTAADIGNAESYMAGEWETSDLVELCRLYLIDQSMLDARSIWTALARLRHSLIRWAQTNTLVRAKQNIQRHYDLSNDFYALFLDDSMTYSSAVFESETATLDEAQQAKIERLCRLLDVAPGQHVLEIGSGWGALAIHLARRHGCRVTSLTLSEQQLAFARRRAEEAGIADRVDFRLCDYRQTEGRFDRIISVEMLEAVGYEYLGTFFERCAELLKR